MKVVFIGTVEFSLKALEKLIELDAEIVGVVTGNNPKFNADFADLKPLCHNNSIPCRCSDKCDTRKDRKWIETLNPDVIFCLGWSSLLGKDILQIPSKGVVGFHPAELPQNRGRHPIIWALVLGLQNTASTFFFMDEAADSGDILSQRLIDIYTHDDAGTLYDRITETALDQIADFLPRLEKGTYQRTPQDHSRANYWRKRNRDDGKIDFRMSSQSVCNLVRALSKPYVGAHLLFRNREYKVWKVEKENLHRPNLEPGKILAILGNTVLVKTGDGAVRIVAHQMDRLPKVGDYFN